MFVRITFIGLLSFLLAQVDAFTSPKYEVRNVTIVKMKNPAENIVRFMQNLFESNAAENRKDPDNIDVKVLTIRTNVTDDESNVDEPANEVRSKGFGTKVEIILQVKRVVLRTPNDAINWDQMKALNLTSTNRHLVEEHAAESNDLENIVDEKKALGNDVVNATQH